MPTQVWRLVGIFKKTFNKIYEKIMKKNFPVAALEILQPFIEKAKDVASPVIDEKYVLFLMDNDDFDVSNYYFRVTYDTNQINYLIEMCPFSINTITSGSYRTSLNGVGNFFDVWLDVMKRYKTTKTVFDNPARSQAQYFYDEFKVVDEDADVAPFNPPQIVLLDEYIDKFKIGLANLKQEENATIIDDIIQECNELQDNIYSIPKNEVINKFAKIWGKVVTNIKKEGRSFIKGAWEEIKKDVIGKLPPLLTSAAGAVVKEVIKQIL